MDAFLKRAVKEHGLTSIGVNFWTAIPGGLPFTVYVHWDDGCRGGNGKTVKAALASALEQMREERAGREAA
jgi:hypothetical protein